MIDFTLKTYGLYLEAILKSYPAIIRFDELFMMDSTPFQYCIIRHDVDRKPLNGLKMAKLENKYGIKSSYYFRSKKPSFNRKIIRSIANLGHEIGYHYECLSDAQGNIDNALAYFIDDLQLFRKSVSVHTVSMHGRPFDRYDNREMWTKISDKNSIFDKNRIFGELYLDIDYTYIAYLTDTGRNWKSDKANRRDKVNSSISIEFENFRALLDYLTFNPYPRLIFQVHPERWTDNNFEYGCQFLKDFIINLCKMMMK